MARVVEQLSIFTRELFSTPHNAANRAAVAAVPAAELDLVGIAPCADPKIVDKVLDKLRPHPCGCFLGLAQHGRILKGMSFTEVFGFAEGEPERPGEPLRPPWLGPPDDELGVAVPQGIVLARSERGAIGLSHAIAHPSGVLFEFLAHARGLTHAAANGLFHEQHVFDDEELPDGLLRLGMELPDGARVSNLGGWRAQSKAMSADEKPEGPVLFPSAGGGGMSGGDRVVMRPIYWLWPLPETGPLRISCEWPVVEIRLATVEIDAGTLVAAAAKSTSLSPSG